MIDTANVYKDNKVTKMSYGWLLMNSLKIQRDVFFRLSIESLKVERSVLFVYLKKIIFLCWSVILKFVTLTLSFVNV